MEEHCYDSLLCTIRGNCFVSQRKCYVWPRRDLNTQPSDLESDALPLRHGVFTAKFLINASRVSSFSHTLHWIGAIKYAIMPYMMVRNECWLMADNGRMGGIYHWLMWFLRSHKPQNLCWYCHDRDHDSAVTRIRTWVVSATTRSTNHYTITAIAPAEILVTDAHVPMLWCSTIFHKMVTWWVATALICILEC